MLKTISRVLAKSSTLALVVLASSNLDASQKEESDLFDALVDMPIEAILELENCYQPRG
jgi:hypothetical protein